MAETTVSTPTQVPKATRRRASRAAGPANGAAATATGIAVEKPSATTVRLALPASPPPRRQPHRTLVAAVALVTVFIATAALAGVVALMFVQQGHAEAS